MRLLLCSKAAIACSRYCEHVQLGAKRDHQRTRQVNMQSLSNALVHMPATPVLASVSRFLPEGPFRLLVYITNNV